LDLKTASTIKWIAVAFLVVGLAIVTLLTQKYGSPRDVEKTPMLNTRTKNQGKSNVVLNEMSLTKEQITEKTNALIKEQQLLNGHIGKWEL